MHSTNDPSKKASITSLLNPQTSPTTTTTHRLGRQDTNRHPSYQHHLDAGNVNYNLRAASWDVANPVLGRKSDDFQPSARPHHQSHMTPDLDGHAARMMRQPPQRLDNHDYYPSSPPQHWSQNSHDVHHVHYPPVYSGNRTALSVDYHPQNSYNNHYQAHSPLPSLNAWHPSERASAMQSQNGQSPERHPQHDSRYNASTAAAPYYQPVTYSANSHYSSPTHQAQQPQLSHGGQPPHYARHSHAIECSPQTSSSSLSNASSHSSEQQVLQQTHEHQSVFQSQTHSRSESDFSQDASHSSRKRLQPDTENQTEPQPKRTKGKAKGNHEGATGSSKRGYSAEKRSKAAAIANVQLPTVSYAPVSNENGKENDSSARMRIVTGDGGQINGLVTENAVPLQPELQFARCMSNRYRAEQFPRCVSCTRRWAGDTCRFQGIRFFLKDRKRDIVGISFIEGRYQDAPVMHYPKRWNVPLRKEHTQRMKLCIAKALLPVLKKEYEHIKLPELIRRPRESEVRATCDTCMTSLFSSSWMCRLCGREACPDCFTQVKELTMDRPGANQQEIAALQAKREKHAHANPFFLSCTRRNEHSAKDFSPVSRFFQEELDIAIPEMERLLQEDAIMASANGVNAGMTSEAYNHVEGNGASASELASPVSTVGGSHVLLSTSNASGGTLGEHLPRMEGLPSLSQRRSLPPPAYTPPNLPPITASMPHLEIPRYTDAELSSGDSISAFSPIWQRGEPIVVTGLLEKFKIAWTPEYFMAHYKEQTCLIIECQTDTNQRMTVGQFFDMFGKYEGRKDCWKLKDWPPSTDFKAAFPELYRDFSEAVPVPDYVRRDGVANVGSHFPSNTVAPDLGPKMYNALASSLTAGSKGSTRLHMDIADALNIMTHAERCPDGSPGCAAWDLFRAEDSDKIRTFLSRKFSKPITVSDPIHSQQYYLDEVLLKELYDEYGVKSFRFYQRPGEAVFIPAGCAHQVANLADCVKVAVDFVSVEHIPRCESLTQEFREVNKRLAWKEDVLQLRNMLWFAWMNCDIWEKGMVNGVQNGQDMDEGQGTDESGPVANGKKKTRAKKRAGGAVIPITTNGVGSQASVPVLESSALTPTAMPISPSAAATAVTGT